MAPREKAIDRGTRRGREGLVLIGRELRAARVDRGLTQAEVGTALGLSAAEVSRMERALAPSARLLSLSQFAAVVGLDLSIRTYAGGEPIRDAGQALLVARLRTNLHRSLGWRSEVPLPHAGDPRAWDGMIKGPGWRFGVEAESAPHDGQALGRRIELKRRDGMVDGVILLLPATRRTREFLEAALPVLGPNFPVPGKRAVELLRAGASPGGSAIVVL
jgi:transcriptional regulator with XRE-family HTH domain